MLKIENFRSLYIMEYTEMKDRIAHIIRAKNLTAAEFALRLGIQPSNVSHLLAGRNNPSLEFVKKLKETFPEYSLEWIVFGKGPMTISEPFMGQKATAEPVVQPVEEETPAEVSLEGTLFAPENAAPLPHQESFHAPKTDLKRIILVYADNSFEVLSPR